VPHAKVLIALVAAMALLPACQTTPSASTAPPVPELERAFAPGGQIQMDLSAGGYVIEGTPDPLIRLAWKTGDPDDARKVHVRVEVTDSKAVIVTDGPSNRFHVTVKVPSRSDLLVDLSAGDLTLRGVEGHKDLSAWAGNVTIDIGRAADYRSAQASVTAGEIDGPPFWPTTGGLLRSRDWVGSGHYDLRVRLAAGDINFRESEAE
jgi:hypothetical protein